MIYTKTGDKGQTSLASGQRVAKTDARIEAYGTVDELNSWIGALRVVADDPQLEWVQNKLFNLGAELSEAPGEWIVENDVNQLEAWIDVIQAKLPALRAFLLPCGSEAVSRCHICRTVCRRAERKMLEANANPVALCFINRLSDYLFVRSRSICLDNGETEKAWKKD